jgi:hypothetical protein
LLACNIAGLLACQFAGKPAPVSGERRQKEQWPFFAAMIAGEIIGDMAGEPWHLTSSAFLDLKSSRQASPFLRLACLPAAFKVLFLGLRKFLFHQSRREYGCEAPFGRWNVYTSSLEHRDEGRWNIYSRSLTRR